MLALPMALCFARLHSKLLMQVEMKMHPQLAGQSVAVLQYNPFGDLAAHSAAENRITNDSNGSIIALSYGAARQAGVKRNMRAAEARKMCPELQLVTVPVSNGKSDLTNYRHHGQAVVDMLMRSYEGCSALPSVHLAIRCRCNTRAPVLLA